MVINVPAGATPSVMTMLVHRDKRVSKLTSPVLYRRRISGS